MTDIRVVALTEADVERIVEKTVNDTLLKLGMSVGDPIEFQKDMHFVRNWRKSSESVKRQGFMTAMAVVTTGVLGFIASTFIKGD
ncbi:hypothetical protein F406_gp016 [Agrobacterium phage 7-7-1]|uniref:Putative membrane protein n=1 Tax=Agrobacterium phage 7-7-1 TaxID=1161931 RepID=J7FA75_9CAUD|nr:hypothetical protein F406_gp016 [Agrobacterium phage 7-7-1]AFH19799.1 putative membrane protein [Agrobacterium phage 7-7-1]